LRVRQVQKSEAKLFNQNVIIPSQAEGNQFYSKLESKEDDSVLTMELNREKLFEVEGVL